MDLLLKQPTSQKKKNIFLEANLIFDSDGIIRCVWTSNVCSSYTPLNRNMTIEKQPFADVQGVSMEVIVTGFGGLLTTY